MINKLLIIGIITLSLIGCSSHNVKQQTTTDIRSYGSDINLVVTGAPAITDKLTRYLQAALLQTGFNLVPKSDTSVNLTVNVSAFSSGDAAARVLVGFGAGRGSLVYKAVYSKNNQTLIEYDGAERFTGAEIYPGSKYRIATQFSGSDEATLILLEEATDHIIGIAIPQ